MTTPVNTAAALRRGVVDRPRAAAAVDLLLWLGKSIPTALGSWGQDVAVVDLDKLRDWSGPWSGGERRVVAVALSLLDGDPVDLEDVLTGLGSAHLAAVVAAITAAAGLDAAAVTRVRDSYTDYPVELAMVDGRLVDPNAQARARYVAGEVAP